MTTKQTEKTKTIEDRNAKVETALIEDYIREKGYSMEDFKKLPTDVAEKLMKEASRYASLKMEEVHARAHFIKELHDDISSRD